MMAEQASTRDSSLKLRTTIVNGHYSGRFDRTRYCRATIAVGQQPATIGSAAEDNTPDRAEQPRNWPCKRIHCRRFLKDQLYEHHTCDATVVFARAFCRLAAGVGP